jgi:hypothetical protein
LEVGAAAAADQQRVARERHALLVTHVRHTAWEIMRVVIGRIKLRKKN